MKTTKLKQAATLLIGFLISGLLLNPSYGQIDREEDGSRYRPQGRAIAREVAAVYSERLYEVRTYEPAPAADTYSAATVFYPLTLSFAPDFPAVVMMPGFRANQSNYDWWGPMLASLGVAVMIVDTNAPNDGLAARQAALIDAVAFLKGEASNADSPMSGKIDTNKISIMGHSMGGGAALAAAADLGDDIKAVVPLAPYCCEPGGSFDKNYGALNTPTLIIASAEDEIAPPAEHAAMLYDAIAGGGGKAYLEFATGDHNIPTNGGDDLSTLGRYVFAWLKLHGDGSAQYAESFSGAGDNGEKFSRFETD